MLQQFVLVITAFAIGYIIYHIVSKKLDELVQAYPKVSGQQPYLSNEAHSVLQQAEKALSIFEDEYIAIEHLIIDIWDDIMFTERCQDI